MPRDYAKTGSRPDKEGQLAGWIWMLGGLGVGLFVAFLVYLNKTVDPSQQTAIIDAVIETANEGDKINEERQKQRDKELKDKPIETVKEKEAEFDFYEILPEVERHVTEQEIDRRFKGTEKKLKTDYYVQVGSFRKEEQAQQYRADLLLKGIEPNIQSVTIKDVTWHRVIIGPINDVDTLNKTRRRLKNNNIHFVVTEKQS